MFPPPSPLRRITASVSARLGQQGDNTQASLYRVGVRDDVSQETNLSTDNASGRRPVDLIVVLAAETRPGKRPPRWEAPDFPRQRPAHCPLTLGNVGGSPTPGNHTAESALAGWGARIRTWEWRNQNPPVSALISRIILKNRRNSTRFRSIG